MRSTMLALLVILVSAPPVCQAQYLYIDTDRDGSRTTADRLPMAGKCALDVWLDTGTNRDGTAAFCKRDGGVEPSIFSYEMILKADGGEVSWGEYRNGIAALSTPLALRRFGNEFYVAFGGEHPLPAGRYRLGQLDVQIVSGAPELRFVEKSEFARGLRTSFGSMNGGKDQDHTLKYSARGAGSAGDWADADGVRAVAANPAAAVETADKDSLRFYVQVIRDHGGAGTSLRVSTSRAGALRIRVYDVHGRLVRTPVDTRVLTPGTRVFPLGEGSGVRIAAGIYFFRVEATEGTRMGRLVVTK